MLDEGREGDAMRQGTEVVSEVFLTKLLSTKVRPLVLTYNFGLLVLFEVICTGYISL